LIILLGLFEFQLNLLAILRILINAKKKSVKRNGKNLDNHIKFFFIQIVHFSSQCSASSDWKCFWTFLWCKKKFQYMHWSRGEENSKVWKHQFSKVKIQVLKNQTKWVCRFLLRNFFFQVCCVYEKLGLDLIFMQVGFHELYPFVQRGKSELSFFFILANKNSTDSPCSNKAVKK